ncbi:hypothetical protein [Aquimarina algiphila]|uniref:Uncharacterized protein n=1 Tax=Aquimarina algiphila TaxID=2047982 RepID=A0A554VAA3_9FLAO|nr:hypothetical protein [Aquimarina algiphila]TSE02924.1 hypothetical protein FOF46_30320 [Aquimarina algiphila]
MPLSAQQKIIRQKEAKIGAHAARLATRYLHKNINRAFDVKNRGGVFQGKKIKPMLRASKVRPKLGEYVLLGLDTTSNKYAFMHHYGFEGKRDGSFVRFSHNRFSKEFTNRESHILNVRDRSIFKDVYKSSGAITYLAKHLAETRTESFQAKFNNLIVTLTQDE